MTYSFPPALSPRAFRWGAIARYLSAEGHEVEVVCARRHDAEDEVVEDPGLRVHRVGPKRLMPLATPSTARKRSFKSAALTVAKAVYDLTWRRFYWPDAAFAWISPAQKEALSLHSIKPFDAMITVSHPFSGHLVGLDLKRKSPRLRWIVDIGDPFSLLKSTPVNNTRLYGTRNRQADRDVLSNCDAITVTTPETRDLYIDAFEEIEDKIRVIGPLLSLPEQEPTSADCSGAARPLTEAHGTGAQAPLKLLFMGTLYGRIRSPGPLLLVFARLREMMPVELHFVGRMLQCDEHFEPYRSQLDESIFIHGEASRERAMAAMKECSALVNIGNETAYQLPSKIVEYVASRKPIVNFAHIPQDSSANFLRRHPCFLNVGPLAQDEVRGVAQRMKEFLCTARDLTPEEVEDIVGPHRLPAIVAKYEELFT